jgi:hypothetical protein
VFEIRTFLRMVDGSFSLVDACEEIPSDPDYVEGAIEIVVDGKEIVGKREWDCVDQLWAYLATMSKQLRRTGEATISYPDQPIEISLKRQGTYVLIASEAGDQRRSGLVAEDEFLSVLQGAGEAFFNRMSRLNSRAERSYWAARAELTG